MPDFVFELQGTLTTDELATGRCSIGVPDEGELRVSDTVCPTGPDDGNVIAKSLEAAVDDDDLRISDAVVGTEEGVPAVGDEPPHVPVDEVVVGGMTAAEARIGMESCCVVFRELVLLLLLEETWSLGEGSGVEFEIGGEG
mmetsp:Transcript_34364/g.55610  ORF Transcript_34364/g.55610 Transcript_34364/m.55610 type:complete len:141 (-) Transcript_34364:35-457(-)